MEMQCSKDLDFYMSFFLSGMGILFLVKQLTIPAGYGKHIENNTKQGYIMIPAKYAWFIQELPSFLVPLLLILVSRQQNVFSCMMLLLMFCGHYFQRTFIYSAFTRGRPSPINIVIMAASFCTFNGFLQGHCMVYIATYPDEWHMDIRFASGSLLSVVEIHLLPPLFRSTIYSHIPLPLLITVSVLVWLSAIWGWVSFGVLIFYLGMGINIHSDHILRNLRKPSEVTYKIPKGGMFNYVSGANFLGEIVEWFGYAIATWSLPAFAFAFFTLCSIGPRAYHHHRYYLQVFKDYPQGRKALIPFVF